MGGKASWLFTKRGLGFENGATLKQIQIVRGGGGGLEPGNFGLRDIQWTNYEVLIRFIFFSTGWNVKSPPFSFLLNRHLE